MKCKSILVLLLFLLTNLLQANVRQKISINSGWKFHKGELTGNNIKWESVNLPHTWNAEDMLDDIPGYYRGIAWYQKELCVPESMQSKEIYLYFEGANQDAVVYINHKEVGRHLGGYTAFCFNITDYLNPSNNVLSIQLDNRFNDYVPPIGGDLGHFGGIYRDVYLIALNKTHFDIEFFASKGVFVTTPQITTKSAELEIRSKLVNNDPNHIVIKHQIYAHAGELIKQHSESCQQKGRRDLTCRIKIKNPQLWSPDSPHNYQLVSQIVNSQKEILDEVHICFGIRHLSADPQKGILLNGQPLFIKGIGKHQDYDKLGYAVPNDICRNDVVLIKKMGANLLRSHYPLDPVTYDMCDKKGVMVWGKIPIMDKINHSREFLSNTQHMMQEVMYQNFNRPSFVLWGFACEIFGDMDWYWPKPRDSKEIEENLKKTEIFGQTMEAFIREIDPYRLTANDFHTDPTPEYYKQANQTALNQVNGWNIYQGWYHNNLDSISWALNTFRAYNPDVPFLIAEFGAGSDPRIHTYEPTIFDFSTEYQDLFHAHYLHAAETFDFVHGLCIWTLVDFQVDGRSDAVPHVNSKGLLRSDRTPKDAYYLYQANWSDVPMIHIAARDWIQRKEIVTGNTAVRPVRVYSNQAEIELLLNGHSLGIKSIQNHMAVWHVPFIQGQNQLTALSVDSEKFLSDHLDIKFEFVSEDFKENGFPESGLCINVGQSKTYFIDDLTQNIWMPDKSYQKGNYGHRNGDYYTTWNTMPAWDGIRQGVGQNIKGTDMDPVYQTFLLGVTDYRIDVPSGIYDITLLFTEPFSEQEKLNDKSRTGASKKGKRIFNVRVNQISLFDQLNLNAQFGHSVAIRKSVEVKTENGIQIQLMPVEGQPVLSAIKVFKLQ